MITVIDPTALQLTEEQLDAYRRDGFLVVRGLAPDAARLDAWIEEVAAWPDTAGNWLHYREATGHGPRLARTENFLPFHDALRELLTGGPVAAMLAQLIGEPAAVLKEKINYKHAGGGGYAPHQDFAAYDFGASHVTCAIAIDRATIQNGCLWFAAGRHREGLIAVDDRGCLPNDTIASSDWIACPLEPGDAAFFSSFAPHYSGPNETNRPRRSLYVTYHAASEGAFRENYYAEKHAAIAAGAAPDGVSKIGHFRGELVESTGESP